MESYDEVADREDAEDRNFMREASQLREVLTSRRRWRWLPWVHETPSTAENIFFDYGGGFLDSRHCWQVLDENLYLAERGGILRRAANGNLVCKGIEYFRSQGDLVRLTARMREMRENL